MRSKHTGRFRCPWITSNQSHVNRLDEILADSPDRPTVAPPRNVRSFRPWRLFLQWPAAFLLPVCAAFPAQHGPSDPNASPQAWQLWGRLAALGQRDQFAFGQQNANVYGIGWNSDGNSNTNRSDIKTVTGVHPAVFGFNPLETSGYPAGLNWLSPAELKNRIKDAHRWGGIVTLYFPLEQVLQSGSWVAPTLSSVQPGGAHYSALTNHLEQLVGFLNDLTDDRGQPIPIIFRPWHEFTGGWFWWSPPDTTTGRNQFINLFRTTVDYLRNRGQHSLLIALAPSGHRLGVDRDFFYAYPGDDYVDIYTVDQYFTANRDFVDQQGGYTLDKKPFFSPAQFWQAVRLTAQAVLSKETNGITKLMGLSEIGAPDGIWGVSQLTGETAANFYKGLLLDGLVQNVPLQERMKISYAMTWRNGSSTHGWIPNLSHAGAADLIAFSRDSRVALLDGVAPAIEFNASHRVGIPATSTWPNTGFLGTVETFTLGSGDPLTATSTSPVPPLPGAPPGITTAFSVGAQGVSGAYDNTIPQHSQGNASFEVWFAVTNTSGEQIVFEAGGNTCGVLIGIKDGVLVFNVVANTAIQLTIPIAPGWHHVVATVSNSFDSQPNDFIGLYLDGFPVGDTSDAPVNINDWAGANQAGFGRKGGATYAASDLISSNNGTGLGELPLRGQIAVYRFYKHVLSAIEVADLYFAMLHPVGGPAARIGTVSRSGNVTRIPWTQSQAPRLAVQVSANLSLWQTIATNLNSGVLLHTNSNPAAYYRLKLK